MRRFTFACVSLIALMSAAAPALAREDCASRIEKLDDSKAEGQDRLDEKNETIEICDRQYKREKTIDGLVKTCAKYEEQAVVKMQAVADCQLAAYRYANELRALKNGK